MQLGDLDRRTRVIALASQKGRAMVLVALPPGKRRDVPSIVNHPLVRAAMKRAGANKVGWHQRMSLPDAITLASRAYSGEPGLGIVGEVVHLVV